MAAEFSAERSGSLRAFAGVIVLAVATLAASPVLARSTIWDLKLGSTLAEMPKTIEFKGYACGSNGGPPLKALTGWADDMQCKPEASGLHEVYFEYDDEDEYIARAHEDIKLARDIGTVDKSFPIIASALFDDAGVLRGIRLVTDARLDQRPDNEWADLRPRDSHHLLAAYLAGTLKISMSTDCKTLPLDAGESAVGGDYVKTDCEHTDPATGIRSVLQQRYYRKEGQAGRDPATGALTHGQYVSSTRAEIYLDAPAKAPAQ